MGNLVIADRHADGAWTAGQHAQFAGTRDGRVKQIALKHGVVLGHDRHHDYWKFWSLGFVNWNDIGKSQLIYVTPVISRHSSVEVQDKCLFDILWTDLGTNQVEIVDYH